MRGCIIRYFPTAAGRTDGVAHVEEDGVGRVVRGADGVEVVALELDQVLQHALDRAGLAEEGVVVVAVHALDDDRVAVDHHAAALRAELHGAEADGAPRRRDRASPEKSSPKIALNRKTLYRKLQKYPFLMPDYPVP